MRPLSSLLVLVLVTACAAKKAQEAASPPPPAQAPPEPEAADEYGAPGGGAPVEQPKLERAAPAPTMHRHVGGDVKLGDARVTGIDAGGAKDTLEKTVDELRKCYEKELLGSPSLAGTADVTISVDKTGKVSASASGVGNAALESCVAETVEKADFGTPKGRAQVTLRITFSPES